MTRLLRWTRSSAFVLTLVAALPALAAAQETGIAIGAAAPSAKVHTLDGTQVALGDYLGKKPTVLEFWATWCPLCKQLEPAMKAAREAHANDVTFIGINVPQNQTPEKVRDFVAKNGMKGLYLYDTDGAAYKAYSAPHTSYVVVLNAAGKVVYTGVGGAQDIEAAIAKAR